MEIELAKNYQRPYLLYIARTHRNPLLEYLLPALLYIKMVSLLDEVLIINIEEQCLTMPKKYRNSLQGRIDFFKDQNILHNSTILNKIREKRNAIAHEISKQVSWNELDTDLAEIKKTLQYLAFIEHRPKYEFFAERSAMTNSTEPGVLSTQDFCYGLKEEGKVIVEVKWTEKLLANEK